MEKESELQRCIKILQMGGLLVAPSDTVYGLVCDATNEEAVDTLIKLKNRPIGKPISVFVDGFEMMRKLVKIESHQPLLQNLLPGPFTVVLPSKHKTSLKLESEGKTLGVRFTTNEWIQKLVRLYGKPLTATSANVAGRPPHYEPQAFMKELPEEKKSLIAHIVDFGKLPHNKPSTLIDLTGSSLQLLRKGDVLPLSQQNFISNSAQETKKIAEYVMNKYSGKESHKPLVFILDGEMGAGKTVFSQGIGLYLGADAIISPTYVVYYEYPVTKNGYTLFLHADLYNIEEAGEFAHLGLEDYLKPNTVVCIEWGNRVGPLFEEIKKKASVIMIHLQYVGEHSRTITINEL